MLKTTAKVETESYKGSIYRLRSCDKESAGVRPVDASNSGHCGRVGEKALEILSESSHAQIMLLEANRQLGGSLSSSGAAAARWT